MKRNSNNKLLVPVDFSAINEVALSHATKVASTYGNDIVLLHVLESSVLKNLFGGDESLIKEAVQGRLDLKAEEIRKKSGVNVETRIAEGRPFKTIGQIANSENFDAIIMGSHGANGVGQLVGSNASRTIQVAEVPVVVVKNTDIGPNGYQKIVMPIDLSVETRQKAEWAIHIGTTFDSEVIILFESSEDEYTRERINSNLNEVTRKLEASQVRYNLMEIEDSISTNFATETLATANNIGADLILVMTHTDRNLGELIIGTMTQQLVNKSQKIPVMCIHPKETGFVYSYS